MPLSSAKTLPTLTVADAESWRQWLSTNADDSPGVWLTLAKKGTVEPTSLSLTQALEEALCYGWINGQGMSGDDGTYAGRFTPRTAKSIWAKRNVEIVERLESEGRMTEAGRTAVEAAKADGRWEKAYEGVNTVEAPGDLLAAIEANSRAKETWDGVSKQSRWMMYFQLNNLRTSAGREKRIQSYADMLVRGETPHPKASTAALPKIATDQLTDLHRKASGKVQKQKSATASSRPTQTRSGRRSRPPVP